MLHNNDIFEKSLKVSVCVVTYNQEKYIRRCLQSIVDQETDFDFEVIVADDCSTDGTRAIVQEFADRYPAGVVKSIFHEKNIGPYKNFIFIHQQAIGEYIAHVDGDDYVLQGKLQKQANFLDQYQNCSFVCHSVHLVNEDGTKILGVNPNKPQPVFSDLDRLIQRYIFFANSSKMYRKSVNVFDHSQDHALIDFIMHVEHASLGNIGFIPEILGVQRKNCGGITTSTGEKLYFLIDLTLNGFERARQLGIRDEIVNFGKSKYLVGAAFLCLSRNDIDGFRKYLVSSRINGKFISFTHFILFLFKGQADFLFCLFRIRQMTLRWGRKLMLLALR